MSDLTDRQLEVFRLIYETARDRGYQPSIRDMMETFGFSPNGVMCHIKAMRRKGYLAPRNGDPVCRAYVILRRPDGSPFTGFAEKGYVDNLYDSREPRSAGVK